VGKLKPVPCPHPYIHQEITVSNCPKCNGSGVDWKRTKKMREHEPSLSGVVRCWTCNGNGWDPVEAFNWTPIPKKG
jgi:DnaJ-class molecular chaperone